MELSNPAGVDAGPEPSDNGEATMTSLEAPSDMDPRGEHNLPEEVIERAWFEHDDSTWLLEQEPTGRPLEGRGSFHELHERRLVLRRHARRAPSLLFFDSERSDEGRRVFISWAHDKTLEQLVERASLWVSAAARTAPEDLDVSVQAQTVEGKVYSYEGTLGTLDLQALEPLR